MHNKLLLIAGGGILSLSLLTANAATTSRAANLKSNGVYSIQSQDGKSVTLDSADLVYLADEIDELETTYKGNLLSAIQSLTDVAKEMVLDKIPVSAASSVEYNTLVNAVKNSQKPHSGDTGATVDNISANKVAFVNGKYLVGNGNDVNSAYTQGYYDGVHYTVANANIEYVYHQHVTGAGTLSSGTLYAASSPGGCYVASGHTHDALFTCAKTPVYGHICDSSCHYVEGYSTPPATSYCTIHSYHPCEHEKPGYVDGHWEHSSNTGIVGYNYSCGYPTNTWVIGCGRTAGVTIDSATVRFV